MQNYSSLKKGDVIAMPVSAAVYDKVDVLVAGGGTAGVLAAIAAARGGAKTLLVEQSGVLGGMLTRGNAGLTKYTVHEGDAATYRRLIGTIKNDPSSVQIVGGITMEITRRLIASGAGLATDGEPGTYVFTSAEDFKCLLIDLMQETKVELLFHSMIVGAIAESNALKGVVMESKSGREIILAKTVIDCTGDGDVASRAGAPFQLGSGPDDLVTKHGLKPNTMQAMGVMFRMANIDIMKTFHFLRENPKVFRMQLFALMPLEEAIERFRKKDMMTFDMILHPDHSLQIYNTPLPGVYTFCCPCVEGNGTANRDLTLGEIELSRIVRKRVKEMKAMIPGFENAFLMDQPEICVRETRHIRGEYTLTAGDIMSMRSFDDSIGRGGHPVDIYPIPPEWKNFKMPPHWSFQIPYRCLVPLAIENLLVAGRCISVTREVNGCTRATVQCMITGEAAGTAAALCIKHGATPRTLDRKLLIAALKEQGAVL